MWPTMHAQSLTFTILHWGPWYVKTNHNIMLFLLKAPKYFNMYGKMRKKIMII